MFALVLIVAACSSSQSGDTSSSSGGQSSAPSTESSGAEAESSGAEADTSSGDTSSGGEDPGEPCFGALCGDDLPCGDGLVCLMHPVEGISRCALADCNPGEPCSGDEYTCGDPLLGAPLGECLANVSGHGWCHPRTCKDGACDVGACVDGLCY
jgi:hypothetical protein